MDSIELLKGLLGHYSPPEQEQQAVQYLTGVMQNIGYDSAFSDAIGNAIGIRGIGEKTLMLLGHIDTVPGFIEPRIEGDLLFGRGAVDAKGPLACFTSAVAQANIGPEWRVVVIGAVCEEGDSRGAKYILDKYKPEMVIIGEPSGCNRITLGYKGSAWIKYSITIPLVHTAARGQSACESAFEYWARVKDLTENFNVGRDKVFSQLTPSLRDMGTVQDGFSDQAYLTMNFRLPPELSPFELLQMLDEIKGNGSISLEDGVPSYKAEKNTPLVRAFLSAIRKSGGNPIFTMKTGTSDMNIVGPAWTIPILAYGPGDSDLDHTPQEHILISEYQAGIQIILDVIQTITKS